MVYYLLVVAPSSAPTPSASSGIYERGRTKTTSSSREGVEEETILDVLEVKGLKIFRAIGAGAGLEDALPIQRTSALLLVAIPSELSLDDLCHFLGHREGLEAVRVVFRNEPRGRFFCPSLEGKSGPGSGGGFYTAILLCRSQAHADALYKANHGKLFSHDSSQDDKGPCCYLAFLEAIVYSSKSWELTRTKSDELQKSSPSDSEMPEAVIPSTAYEVPSCPVCIERIDVSGTGLVTHSHGWSAEHQDAGRPPTCVACAIITATNGGAVQRKNVAGNAVTLQCECCSKQDELWVCLICGHLGCGRYQDAHAKDHATEYRHRFCYQLDTGRIWDYASDVFVHRRLVQHAAMGRFELALPAPAMEESSSSKVPVPGHEQLLSMELDAILASQLDHQRSLYERQLADLQRQQSVSVNDLQQAIEAEGRREAALTEEIQSHEKQTKVLEKQLASAQKSWSAEQEKLKFAKELNASLLQNRKDMADGEGKESKTEVDALLLRLREKVALLREQVPEIGRAHV